jgi:hypothetical protein
VTVKVFQNIEEFAGAAGTGLVESIVRYIA